MLGNRDRIQLDGSGSYDADQPAETLTYLWDYGNDGTYDAVGVRPYITAADLNGQSNIVVRLKVLDDDSGTRSNVVRVHGEDTSVLRIRSDNDGVVGQRRVISLKLYGPTVTREHYTYTVDWGDGSQPRVVTGLSGSSISKRYNKAGNYTIRATVVSNETGLETSYPCVIRIRTVQQQGRDFADSATSGDDYFRVFTDSGRDQVTDLGGNNRIEVGDGSNLVRAGAGNDTILGGAQDDNIRDEGGRNYIYTFAGNDFIIAFGTNSIDSGTGDDTVFGDFNLSSDDDLFDLLARAR